MPEQVDGLFTTPAMSSAFSPSSHVQHMLLFEAALARASARAGVIPQEAAQAIAACCRVELFDVAALYREATSAGTPAIPLVRMLTAHVTEDARKYVHWGATSQDAIDSALMLQMREGLDLLVEDGKALGLSCANLADQHRHTVMAGRTLLQQAAPITFGLKAARWLALITRQLRTLHERRRRALAVQLGGAVGTLAALGVHGTRVAELLAAELDLPTFDLPWHAERDRVAEIATSLGIVAASMEKIAGDLVLLAQTEVGEAQEAKVPGKGGSSALPQKHNPVDAMRARAAAHQAIGLVPVILSAMAQEHERGAGGWQTEWSAIPNLFCLTACAVESVKLAVSGLKIDPARMLTNIEEARGLLMAEALTMALAVHMGRDQAYRLVEIICQRSVVSGESLRQAALVDQQVRQYLSVQEVEQALHPVNYLGNNESLIDRALAAYHKMFDQ